ncbi:MAG: MerR family DNA-binding protein [Curvibacter sp.]
MARIDRDYRQYREADIHAMRLIKHSRHLGFSVAEIAELLGMWQSRRRTSATARSGPIAPSSMTSPARQTLQRSSIDAASRVPNNGIFLGARR